jgi:hypothetical protein
MKAIKDFMEMSLFIAMAITATAVAINKTLI